MANGTSQSAITVGSGTGAVSGGNGDDILLAEPQVFTASFAPVNGSGVAGTMRVSLDSGGLHVQADLTGLAAGQAHAMHIHGLLAAGHTPMDSLPLVASLDTDRDGFIELGEARPAAGPVLMSVGNPVAAADGSVHVNQTFALDALPGLSNGVTLGDLLPLDFRAVEVHGMNVPAGAGTGTSGEVDGSAGYKAALPVAAALLQAPGAATVVNTAVNVPGVNMLGGNGNDHLVGGHGDDLLVGGRGNDILAGGLGNDDLVGGQGGDRFLVGHGKDVITDFNAAEGDRLVFSHDGSSAALVLHDTQQGTWVVAGTGAVEDPATQGVLLLGVHVHAATDAAGWFA